MLASFVFRFYLTPGWTSYIPFLFFIINLFNNSKGKLWNKLGEYSIIISGSESLISITITWKNISLFSSSSTVLPWSGMNLECARKCIVVKGFAAVFSPDSFVAFLVVYWIYPRAICRWNFSSGCSQTCPRLSSQTWRDNSELCQFSQWKLWKFSRISEWKRSMKKLGGFRGEPKGIAEVEISTSNCYLKWYDLHIVIVDVWCFYISYYIFISTVIFIDKLLIFIEEEMMGFHGEKFFRSFRTNHSILNSILEKSVV